MEALLELVGSFLFELVLEVVGGFLVELGFHALAPSVRGRTGPVLAVLAYTAVGAGGVGFLFALAFACARGSLAS